MHLPSQIGFRLEGLSSVARSGAVAGNVEVLKHLASSSWDFPIAGLRHVARLGATVCTPTQFAHSLRTCSIKSPSRAAVCGLRLCAAAREPALSGPADRARRTE